MRTTLLPSFPRRAAVLSTAATGAVTAALLLVPAAPSVAIPPGGAVDRSNGAKVKLSTSSVKRGGRIKVTGTNWRSTSSRASGRSEVTIKLDDRDILAVLPIRKKRFSGYVTIPRPVAKGRHTLRFLASKPATSIKSKTIKVR
ncbi:hypothetical protein AB0L40_15930 [Patulibacter sp. NPDC049589]|uniref:hypothetical protein n=1 Tax=Patulibacter sp. NPDC049589 TaxID=3154731 RepID=UPI00343C1752